MERESSLQPPCPHLLHVDLKGPLGLTFRTGTRLHLLVLGLEEGPEHEVTLVTVVLDHAELGEHAGAAAHHTTGPNQLVQVELPGKRKKKKTVCKDEEASEEQMNLTTCCFIHPTTLLQPYKFFIVCCKNRNLFRFCSE